MRRLHHRVAAWKGKMVSKTHDRASAEEDPSVDGDSSSERDGITSLHRAPGLCKYCRALEFNKYFRSLQRAYSAVHDYMKLDKINTLQIVTRRKNCPFCRLILRIISSSSYTMTDQPESDYDPNGIYIKPQRIDFALCGIESLSSKTDFYIGTCLLIQLGRRRMQDRIVLCTEADKMYCIVKPLRTQVDFNYVREWIKDCESEHESCCASPQIEVCDAAFRARTRVINVQSRSIIQADLSTVKYAALTYVWGNYVPDLSNIEIQALPSQLPATFEDAMAVCSMLDIPYIWIDMFCINQADEMDKNIQVPRMDAVYDGAFLTIVAVENRDPTTGLPRVRPTKNPNVSNPSCWFEKMGGYELAIVPGFVVPRTTWNTRAWTLQEALLSKRLLVFNENYVTFYCRSTANREDLKFNVSHRTIPLSQWTGLSGSPFRNEYHRSEFSMEGYTELVNLYTSRNMSNPEDALAAVSGMLNTWSRSSNMEFTAGIPTKNPTNALIWYGREYSSRELSTIPSWSSAAWKGTISYPQIVQEIPKSTDSVMASLFQHSHVQLVNEINYSKNLPARVIAHYQPGQGTNASETLAVEEEALFSVSTNTSIPQLQITSYIARFRLPLTDLRAYKDRYDLDGPYDELVTDQIDKPLNTMALISSEDESKPRLTIISSPSSFESSVMRLQLPGSLSQADEQRIRNEECEFILVKRWHYTYRLSSHYGSKHQYRVWALLIMRDKEKGVAKRLGCIAIHTEVWRMGNPKWETVVLE